ncbi:hypothetical protein [Paenibacillus donghaensis]|uniref:Uncharacterized protein n=1 Tax=Paenibacillus donghaensis TaxID=414771 RepID=A0A2Z2KPT7_9BACL|nr:hypothetical protein [Paenibacillus donghaensis]ASA24659.1 hypothetical protein B9T62_30245 [Paenibacillus donghaensis]
MSNKVGLQHTEDNPATRYSRKRSIKEAVSSLSAMNQGGGYLMGAMGPLLVGQMHDWWGGFRPALIVLAVLVVLLIGVQLQIGRSARLQQHLSNSAAARSPNAG